ncbi:MAG: DNA/RNA nuclease SfsA [Cyanobacteria bacterium P01_A01_bin.105]
MASPWFYPYPKLLAGRLVKRYKRFLADIALDDGTEITAHCPNTGPMTGVCHLGGRVMVSQSDNPKRKLAYTWELADVGPGAITGTAEPIWAGVNTALPNRVVRSVLEAHLLPQLGAYQTIRSEVKYGQDGKSRIDFLLPDANPAIYIEVKNTTWAEGRCALFPDTVTTRGQKHLRELTALLPDYRAVMLYFINRGDCDRFSPGDSADADYGQLLRVGVSQGLEVLPCRFHVTPTGMTYGGLATLALSTGL